MAIAAAVLAAAAFAAGEHERRLAAELVVLADDVQRLRAASEPPAHLAGVRARVAGALATLPLLLREARGDAAAVPALRAAHARGDWPALARGVDELSRRHPFDLARLPTAPTPQRLALGAAIHREACAGCHDAPAAADAKLPALDLYRLAAARPPAAFAARLHNGVRGDASTGLRNPFGDSELGALIAHYRHGAPRRADVQSGGGSRDPIR